MKINNLIKSKCTAFLSISALLAFVSLPCSTYAQTPNRIAAAGDSITMAFAANCVANTRFFDLFCLLGGDQPTRSWFDGSNSSVDSVHDKYKLLDSGIDANKNAAGSGAELRGGNNNFATQAANITSQTVAPDHVEVLLGGNDICNRDCVDPNNCSNPLYTENQWTESVQAGIDTLVAGLPLGSTVYLGSVPRVHDLRAAGLSKQASNSRVNCESIWSTFSICPIATSGGSLNGESISQRLAVIADTQRRYNEILRDQAQAYNINSNGRNPRGIEVITDYVDENTLSTGTLQFGQNDIDGGDCFHPSVSGQNTVADLMWNSNTDR